MEEKFEEITTENLIKISRDAQKNAYTPYSNFKVGAALVTKEGKVYSGCNIENAAYGPTNCAERTAFFKAISEGEKEFTRIAIISDGKDYCYPCGVCRQVMSEFCDPETFEVICAKNLSDFKILKLKELLPFGFKL